MAASGLSIKERLEESILAHPDEISALKSRIETEGKGVMKPLDLLNHLISVNSKKNGVNVGRSALVEVLSCSQEAVITQKVAELSIPEYLQLKENVVDE
ncbi:SAGA histone acetylase and TREX-2 complexes component, partial [Datura stramonium]|nr:SAGA histone acetylase and TREX-2 complexes component [Datura stramonium]